MPITPAQETSLERLTDTLQASHSTFHAIAALVEQLKQAGYEDYSEQALSELKPGDKGYLIKNDSALLAFHIGQQHAGEGFRIIGSHSDSPCFRVKPNAIMKKEGAYVLNTEVYGGTILHTWLNRPLSLAGRVIRHTEEGLKTELVDLKEPLIIIPTLAIHMDRKVNEGVAYEKQKDMLPILTCGSIEDEDLSNSQVLTKKCAQVLGCDHQEIIDFDLFIYDPQPPMRVGLNKELLNSPRLDNIAMAQASISALLNVREIPATALVFVADHEEIGSRSMQGAFSLYLRDQMERIHMACGGSREAFLRNLDRSFLISADQAHAVHPHHPEVADPTNRPQINHGPVIKLAANQSYTTDAYSAAIFKACCKRAGVPCQQFVNHSDRPGGSTIGPITTSFLHCPGVDVGNALWGMHSARETGGVLDQYYMEGALRAFLETDRLERY